MPRNLVALLALAFAIPFASAQDSPNSASLLPNGTFETADAAGQWPDAWPRSAAATLEKEGGNNFVRLRSTGPGKMDSLHMTVNLSSDVKALEFSYRARVSDFKKGAKPWFDARVIFNFKDAEGNLLKSGPPSYLNRNTSGWVDRTARFLVPDNAVILELMPSLFQVTSGVFDLDNLVLKPIDATELKEQLARNAPPPVPEFEQPATANFPSELRVDGNRLRDQSGREVWLQGVNVPSLEWVTKGENVRASTVVAIEQWKSNVIRIPVKEGYWFGRDASQSDGGKAYRELLDQLIVLAANRGVYSIIDLHNYRAPKPEHLEFWTSAATVYKNHPAVLFGLLNEPHSTTWEVWRDGGYVQERKAGADEDHFLSEEDKINARLGFRSPGMQKVLETVRATGARNIAVVGGLDYAYDLSGILKGFALKDSDDSNGIMYDTHVYPWKYDWQAKFLDVAAVHPILIGEVGADNKPQPWETSHKPPEVWLPDMLGLIQKHRLNWTGWCFHPKAGPAMLSDWRYTPSPYWGAYAKRALAGEQFELKKLR